MENYMCLTVYCRNLYMNNARDRAFSALSHFYLTKHGFVQRLLGGITN